jgi:lipopolysaccharide export system permease protein
VITILDRYVTKQFLFYFIAGLLVFVTLFMTIDFITSASRYQVDLAVYGKYYSYYTLEIIYQLIPVACLLATVFTLSSLNKNSELIVMFSLGMSLLRVSLPIIIMVTVFSVATFFLSNEFMTKVIDKKNYIYLAQMKKKPWMYATSKQENIWYRSGQNIFNIDLLNAKEARAFGVTVYTFSLEWSLQQILEAKEAKIENGQWTLENGKVTVFYDASAAPISEPFGQRVLTLGENVIDIKTSSKASASMGVRELKKYIERNKDAGLNTTAFEVDYHAKFSFVFTAIVMVLLGIPFSTSNNRSGGVLINLQICLLLTLVYWAIYSSGLTLGRYGAVPPMLAAWGPNLAMIVFGYFLIWRQKK